MHRPLEPTSSDEALHGSDVCGYGRGGGSDLVFGALRINSMMREAKGLEKTHGNKTEIRDAGLGRLEVGV